MPDDRTLNLAIKALKAGELIGLPTETVYGLAGDAGNADAVARIYALKGRPAFNPLIAHVSSKEMADEIGQFNELANALAEAFWPGPLTLVVPSETGSTVTELARAGLDTQAIRFPDHPIAQTIISGFDAPIVAPSANLSGQISPTRASHVRESFGEALDIIIDGGASVLGLESTVIACLEDEATLLRSGTLPVEEIADIIGPLRRSETDNEAPRSPGMLSRHYAPDASLRLNVTSPSADEMFLGFGPASLNAALNLSDTGDLTEAAANLYHYLRTLDKTAAKIAVAPIPDIGLGLAINDRLRRAALSK